MSDSLSIFISWPSAPLTECLVRKAIAELGLSGSIHLIQPHSYHSLLQWSTYDDLDHDATRKNPQNVLSSSYTIRKALIRKHFLSRCIQSYLTKHPHSVLKHAVPRTWDLEISYADELDEMWSDELWDLGNELDDPYKWWILKPGMADRGMGIRLFNSKEALQRIFESFEGDSDDEDNTTDDTAVITSQLRHFVIQEYLSTPLLLDPHEVPIANTYQKFYDNFQGHKFHLRAYCVASGALKLYLYTRILALFSATPYESPAPKDSENGHAEVDLAAHLTNTSLQTHRGEDGVRLLDELSGCSVLSHLHESVHSQELRFTSNNIECIQRQMADILAETFKAAIEMTVHFQPLPNAFELYGVDFLVSHEMEASSSNNDARFGVKLLEINAEPAIELTGPRLTWILEDLFKAIGKVCIGPFSGQIDAEESTWEVGEVRHNLHKCLELEIRGSGGW
ncbi:tubulin-tyrosine ligase family-domain-containing protein [Hygrophoropsis aurantiaca]|uniref:Tubulin-tyrosine ligase family-domain-containing protein n=1 Tax=Hygrophoropsis aurantiaca TaxID=72124 RepID=A0ACB8AR20_9AGAM|nr:tubulin-tyrosine ligase family-domain-containing protein [Hygrophoropsis aurantiaca]